jgi:hypothetical protein
MTMTEIRVKGEAQHQILPREELGRLLEHGQVEGVFKYALSARHEPAEAETKATFNTGHSGLRSDRPTASAVITASTVDRDGDIVRADGLDVANYLKNPIVLPMHTLSADVYPVAMTERMKQTRNSWWAKFQWLVDLDATAQRAAEYMQLWDAGVLNCTSIGFIPTKWEPIKDGGGYDFMGSELLEFSTVFIPSNRDALRTEGMKQFLQVAGELITAGPSPLMKGWLVAREAEGRAKQVAVPSAEWLTRAVDRANTGNVLQTNFPNAVTPGPASTLVTYTVEGGVAESGDSQGRRSEPAKGAVLVAPGSYTEIERDVSKAIQAAEGGQNRWVWIEVLYADRVIYCVSGEGMDESSYFDRAYTRGADRTVALGDKKELDRITVYVPRGEQVTDLEARGYSVVRAPAHVANVAGKGFDDVKLACAAGVLSTERAFEIVERLMSEQKSGADAARAEAESWKSQCAALSARVVVRG